MITILCPTRGRPESMAKLFKSVCATSEAEIIFAVDDDDPRSVEMAKRLGTKYKVSRRSPDLASRYNEICELSKDIIMIGADDITFETMGWDNIIEREFDNFPDKLVLVYADDGHFHSEFATHPFVHKKWVEKVGYLMPEGMSRHLDRWLWHLAEVADRIRYVSSVLIRHPFVNRTYDQTMIELESNLQRDDGIYRAKVEERQRDALRLASMTKIKFL